MKVTLYRPSWQKLRVSCIAKFNPYKGFTTLVGSQDNINRLFNYLNDANMSPLPEYVKTENERMGLTPAEELACRAYRVHNMLTATHMGFQGIHQGGSDLDRLVVEAREKVVAYISSRDVMSAARKWDWDVFAYEMETMWREEVYWFKAIYSDLKRRSETASRRRTQQTGVDDSAETRRELARAMQIMTNINDRR